MKIYDSIECEHCGNIVPMGKYCIYCKNPVNKNIQKKFFEVICPSCEAITPSGDFCLFCGEDISDEPLYIRAMDTLCRDYETETYPIADLNIFMEKFYKVKEFEYFNAVITFKDGLEENRPNFTYTDFLDLNIMDIKTLDITLLCCGTSNLVTVNLNRRIVKLYYTCEETVYLFEKTLK